MFKSAFLSEYSLTPIGPVSRILKTHLLSNSEIIIPAAAMRHDPVSRLIVENLEILPASAVKFAHGNDCADLNGYLAKYPDMDWPAATIESFAVFQAQDAVAIYDLKDTFERFNKVMRECASGRISGTRSLFSSDTLNQEILATEYVNLFAYFDLVEQILPDESHRQRLSAFMKYLYNLCGALSTESGNTFSIENVGAFSHIAGNTQSNGQAVSGLGLLVSCALDLTDGLEDFSFLDDMADQDFDRLSFEDVLEIRQSWLHDTIIQQYEGVVEACVAAIGSANTSEMDLAVSHIERAFELKTKLMTTVQSRIQSEVRAYKIHRISRFLADSAITFVEFFSGVSLLKSIGKGLTAATTEVAVLTNRERQLKKLISDKKSKLDLATQQSELILGSKSPTLEYLRSVNSRLN